MMNELSAEARALLAAAQEAELPTAADKARIKAKLLAATAAGATAGVVAATATSKLSLSSVKVWLASLTVVGGVGVVTTAALLTPNPTAEVQNSEPAPMVAKAFEGGPAIPPEPPAPQASAPEPPAPQASAPQTSAPEPPASQTSVPQTAESGAPDEGEAATEVQEPRPAVRRGRRPLRTVRKVAAPAVAERPSRPEPDEPAPLHDLAAETRLVRRMRAALKAERYEAVLQLGAEHRRSFAKGLLTEERLASEARAACGLGRSEQAGRHRKALETLAPKSPLLAQLTCDR